MTTTHVCPFACSRCDITCPCTCKRVVIQAIDDGEVTFHEERCAYDDDRPPQDPA